MRSAEEILAEMDKQGSGPMTHEYQEVLRRLLVERNDWRERLKTARELIELGEKTARKVKSSNESVLWILQINASAIRALEQAPAPVVS